MHCMQCQTKSAVPAVILSSTIKGSSGPKIYAAFFYLLIMQFFEIHEFQIFMQIGRNLEN